ncbi:hypothetical protein [Aureibaculum conchae]|uniref:hypothetical protein n=1 Tax=Aureibaculum sp. 2308TA14-22 TaxID=3108392 RepID=UPI0033997D51
MFKSIILTIVFLFFWSLTSNGQLSEGEKTMTTANLHDFSTLLSTTDLRDKDVKGNVYINAEFSPAKLSNNKTIYSANYNAYQDQIVINANGKKFTVAKSFDNTVTFLNDNKVYKAYNYEEHGKNKTGFFVVLTLGKELSLLNKERIKFYEEKEAHSGYDSYIPPTFKRESDELFLGFKDYSAKKVPNKKKHIFKLFKDKGKEVEKFAKDNKLNPKKENDLIKLVMYYNTL